MDDLITKPALGSFSLKAETPGSIAVEFATLNSEDKDGDVTLPGAIGKQDVRIQPHGHDTYSSSIGKGVASERGNRVIMEGMLNIVMPEGKSAYESLKFDLENGPTLQEWSYTFKLLDWEFKDVDGRAVRYLKKLKIFSVDPVFIGAGNGTRTMSVKSYTDDDDFQKAVEAAVEKAFDKAKQATQQDQPNADAVRARLEYERDRFKVLGGLV